jgi:hypothetical protein
MKDEAGESEQQHKERTKVTMTTTLSASKERIKQVGMMYGQQDGEHLCRSLTSTRVLLEDGQMSKAIVISIPLHVLEMNSGHLLL